MTEKTWNPSWNQKEGTFLWQLADEISHLN
jgi:hypothetical protein